MKNCNNAIGSNQCYLPDLAGSAHLKVQSATHSSRLLLALWLAAGFLAWVNITIADEKPARTATAELLQPNAEYSAISYMGSAGPGAMKYRNGLAIQQAPGMIRFAPAENKQGTIQIFRYDKGIVWTVHPENRLYPGVKKYQEFELRNGMGFNSHIDNLMQAYAALKHRDEMKNLGMETVDGYATSHFQKRDPIPWLPNEFVTTDYWVSDSGVLMKVTVVTPEVSSVMETKAIRFGKQPAALFVPPSDYEKAGNMIDWAEEARIIKAAGRN